MINCTNQRDAGLYSFHTGGVNVLLRGRLRPVSERVVESDHVHQSGVDSGGEPCRRVLDSEVGL